MKKKKKQNRKHIGRTLTKGLLLCVLVGVGAWFFCRVVSHGTPPETPTGEHLLTVLTYNTGRMGEFKKADRNAVIRNIVDINADIVCLQEVEVYKDKNYLTLHELKKALGEYPYTYFDFKIYNKRRQYGLAVFSRYPLIHKTTIQYASVGNISDYCDVVVGKDTIRLFNNHLESNRLTATDLPDSLSRDGIVSSAQRINNKMEKALPTRKAQALTIRQAITESPYPALVVGDFNSLPTSWVYATIRGRDLQDAFLKTSWLRLGNTYTTHHLGVRIDYVLTSKNLTPLCTEVLHLRGSDHYPLLSTISW